MACCFSPVWLERVKRRFFRLLHGIGALIRKFAIACLIYAFLLNHALTNTLLESCLSQTCVLANHVAEKLSKPITLQNKRLQLQLKAQETLSLVTSAGIMSVIQKLYKPNTTQSIGV